MPFRTKKTLYTAAFASILLFSSILAFHDLGVEPFQDYDEATYAEVTRESLERGNYLSLTFLNNDYFRKPPLLFWMTTTFERIIPSDEFAMRLPSALAVFFTVLLVMLICLEAGAGIGVALLGGAIMATTSAFMEPARQARFDVLITFFMLLALYAGMRAVRAGAGEGSGERKQAWWHIALGIALALAFLTKSVISGFAVVALAVYFVRQRGWSFLRDRWLYGGIAAFIIVAAPWHLYQTIQHGVAFWQSYLGNEVFNRTLTNLLPDAASPTNLEYFGFLFRFTAPWFGLFCVSVVGAPFLWRAWKGQERSLYLACVAAVVSVLGVMLASSTKAVTYLIPLYPFMVVALTLALGALWRRSSGEVRAAIVGVLAVSLFVAGFTTVRNVFHINPYFGTQYSLAVEQRALSERIIADDETPLLYTYKNDRLGAIQYYTRLPFTENPYVYTLEEMKPGSAPGYVITPVSLAELRAQFPQFTIRPFYTGSFLSVFTIAS